MRETRIGLWDPTGLWGTRVFHAIKKMKDVRVSFAVYRPGGPLTYALRRLELVRDSSELFPELCFLDGTTEELAAVNKGQIEFLPLSALQYQDQAEMILDMTTQGDGGLGDDYQHFRGPVVCQHTAQKGLLIAPPVFRTKAGANRYHQSACIVSAIMPILYYLREWIRTVDLHVVMQVDEKTNDFTIPERLSAFRLVSSYERRLSSELDSLLNGEQQDEHRRHAHKFFTWPNMTVHSPTVLQFTGLSNYAVTIEMEVHENLTLDEVKGRIQAAPHTLLAQAPLDSTYQLNLARALPLALPPSIVFESSLKLDTRGKAQTLSMVVALDYHTIAVVPFLDAIYMLGKHTEPLPAMHQTDNDLGYAKR